MKAPCTMVSFTDKRVYSQWFRVISSDECIECTRMRYERLLCASKETRIVCWAQWLKRFCISIERWVEIWRPTVSLNSNCWTNPRVESLDFVCLSFDRPLIWDHLVEHIIINWTYFCHSLDFLEILFTFSSTTDFGINSYFLIRESLELNWVL